jgi:hypothetical protein
MASLPANPTVAAVEAHRDNMATIILAIAVPVVVLLFWVLSGSSIDPREPPEMRPKIPFLGHVIGMLAYHVDYHTMLK